MNKIDKAILIILSFFAAALFFVYLPVSFYTDAECLKQGYPRAYVTIGLERYCGTIEGSVNAKVIKQ